MLLAEFILSFGGWHIGPGPGSQIEWCHAGFLGWATPVRDFVI